jgi:hypothetical protein
VAAARGLAVALVLALLGCGGGGDGGTGGPAAPSATGETLSLRLETAHFRIHAGQLSDADVRAAGEALEAIYPRVVSDLDVPTEQVVTARIWQDRTTWDQAVRAFFGRSFQTTGYVTGPGELRALATEVLGTTVRHEFCHVASLWLNPTIANNPRWLWESVALYENSEFVDPRGVAYMASGQYPTLAQLDADITVGRQVYEVGYLIGEYVVHEYGQGGLVDLIVANGNTQQALGVSTAQFEAGWHAFVRERYF